MPVDSLQKQEGRHAPMSGGRARGLDYGVRKSVIMKYRRLLIIKNSGEQRETAENSEASRCFLDRSSSKTQAFLRRRLDLSL
jgi:hypothetical protein